MNPGPVGRLTGKEATLVRRRRVRSRSGAPRPVLVDCTRLAPADLVAIDLLARIALGLRRQDRRVVLAATSPELAGLIAACGLAAVLPCLDEATHPGERADQPGRRSGRPNIGKKRAVSRKKVIPAIRPSRSSRTWSDHGA